VLFGKPKLGAEPTTAGKIAATAASSREPSREPQHKKIGGIMVKFETSRNA
jgi:hypothetical protein